MELNVQVLRDHCLSEEVTLCPPWCVTVRVSGHSFQPGREHFNPRCSLTRPRVVSHRLTARWHSIIC